MKNYIKKDGIMKQLLVACTLILLGTCVEATFTAPVGAEIHGAGSTLAAGYMSALISQYNKLFPCPKFVYKQTPTGVNAGSLNGFNRLIDGSVAFAVSDTPLTDTMLASSPNCLLQIPFILKSLSIIYNLPSDFPTNPISVWPGHLNISPEDLCVIYTSGALNWGGAGTTGLLNRLYNGNQSYNPTPATQVKAYARADSSDDTGLFVQYLGCANAPASGTCLTFLNNVTPTNQNGPFCSGIQPTWNVTGPTASVTCVIGADAIAQQVATHPGSIGYVQTDVAYNRGFFPGSPTGIPVGVAGLFISGSTATGGNPTPQDNAANYTQPTTSTVQAAMTDCAGNTYLCINDAYPIVVGETFIVKAMQPDTFTACNLAQFITYALTQGQKIGGFTPLEGGCISKSLGLADEIQSAICEPCIEPCNPCLNQTCPLPCFTQCKQ